MKTASALKLAASVVVCLLAGTIGSLFTAPAIPGWYASLIKPEIAPPDWLFAPVWTGLFILMGISAWLVWQKLDARRVDRKRKNEIKFALWIFAAQLALNILWSVIFFGLQNPGVAFVEIIILWLLILATILKFQKISRLAAWLLAPYIIWVTFAAYLNYFLWMLN